MDDPRINPKWPQWMADHVRSYLASNGVDGHLWRGVPTLLLTTRGVKSGEARIAPLIYGVDAMRHIVVASRGGAATHPQWYRNLKLRPEVDVQVADQRFRARARTATADEKPALWKMMVALFPPYAEYQQRTTRQIPVVVIERA